MRRYKKIVPVLVASMTLSLFQPVSMNWASADTASVAPAVPAVPAEPAATAKPATTPEMDTAATAKPMTTPKKDTAATETLSPDATPTSEGLRYKLDKDHAVVTGYSGSARWVEIPEKTTLDGEEYPVTEIGDRAFSGSGSLLKLTLPEGLTAIGASFINGTGITDITIPKNVEKMIGSTGLGSFHKNSTIRTVRFEDGMKKIPDKALYYNGVNSTSIEKDTNHEGVHEVILPSTVTEIGGFAFLNCSKLKEIQLPEGLVKIGDSAFCYCVSMTTMELPEGLKEIGSGFINGTEITDITIPSTVERMTDNVTGSNTGAFYHNKTIRTVKFEEGMKRIPKMAMDFGSELTNQEHEGVHEVILPSTVTEIGADAFSYCSKLEEIQLPEGLEKIEDSAFRYCVSLTTMKLPEGLKEIGKGFITGTGITDITIPKTVEKMTDDSQNQGSFDQNSTIQTVTFQEGMKKIPDLALRYGSSNKDQKGVYRVVLPSTVTEIGYSAFSNCSRLNSIELPEGLEQIGNNAFYGCKSLTTMKLPDSITKIGKKAFSGCDVQFHCGNKWSYAYRYAFLSDRANRYDTDVCPERTLLNEKGNNYTIGVNTNSYLQYKINYSVKEKQFYKNRSYVLVHFQKSVDIQEKSVYVDGEQSLNCEYNDRTLWVPVTKEQGSIVFYISAVNGKAVDSMALYSRSQSYLPKDIEAWEIDKDLEMINTVTSDRRLTLTADYNEGKDILTLSGEAMPDEKITLKLSTDSSPITITANKVGTYRKEIENPVFGKNGKIGITAEAYRVLSDKVAGEGQATPVERVYAYQTVEKNAKASDIPIEEFTMYYRKMSNKVYNTNMLTDRKFISYNPHKSFTFNIKLKDRSDILGVYVVAESGSEREELKAAYNERTGMYVASGTFGFLPNKIGLEFSTPYEPQYEWSEEDVEITNQRAGMSSISISPCKYVMGENGSYGPAQNEDGSNTYNVSIGGMPTDENSTITMNTSSLSKVVTQGVVTTASAIMNYIAAKGYNVGTDLQASVMAKDGRAFLVIRADNGEKLAVFTLDIPKSLNEKYMAQAGTTSGAAVGAAAQIFTDADAIQTLIREITAQSDEDAALQELEIVLSDETAGTICKRLQEGNEISRIGLDAARDYVMDLLVKGGRSIDAKYKTIIAAGKTITHQKVEDVIADFSKNEEYRVYGKEAAEDEETLKAKEYYRFSRNRYGLDPSGIVYEAVPSNPLSGVTATLYYRADENSKAVKWDAENYDQINPQITDETGAYQWDVVNGQWQVVFTKDGYEEARSEWLPVPPVQLGINIPMISKAAPKLVQSEGDVERLKLTYDKYLDISTITADNVTVKTASGKLVEVTAVEAGEKESTSLNADDANAAEYSKEIVISGDFAKYKGQKLIVSVGEGVKSYAGTSVTQKDAEIQLTGVLSLTVDKQECSMIMGESERVQVKVDGMENAEIVTGASFGLADVRDTGLRTEDGAYIYEIKANSVGEFEVTFGVKGTDLSATVSVNVEARTLKKNGVIITSDISKEYDGKAVSKPAYVTSGSGVVTIEYMQGKTVLAEAPKLPGKYTVHVNVAADEEYGSAYAEREFEITGEVPVTNPPAQTPTGSATTAPTQTPTGTATTAPTKTPVPSATATTEPTATVAPTATVVPTATTVPTVEPTEAPTEEPTQAPTKKPEGTATAAPTQVPTTAPTQAPTAAPTKKPAAAKKSFVVKGVTYKVTGKNTVSYAKAKKGVKGSVAIPATVKNGSTTYKVTSLANNVFKGNKKITKVVIGANITKIGKNAFNKCAKLKQIVIKTTKLTAGSVGKNAFAGIHKKAVIKVPKAQKKSYTKLLKKSGVKGSMKIKA